MTCEEARQYLWRVPFQPVRIRLKDGRTFDIPSRAWTMAAEAILIIGLPPEDEPNARLPDRGMWVRWPDVEAIEPLSEPAELGCPNNSLCKVVGRRIAMTCEEARQYLWREPFQPVRIRLKDGRTFPIRHAGWALAAESILIIGIPPADDPNSRFSDRGVWVRWPEVEAIELLSEPAAPAV